MLDKIAAGVAAVALVAGGIAYALSSDTAEATTTVAAQTQTMSRAQFLTAVRQAGAGTMVAQQTDAYLVDSAKSLCADMDRGATAKTFASQVYQYGIDAGVFRELLRASVLTYCPQHEDVL